MQLHFAAWELYKSVPGWAVWDEGEWLSLPIHQLLVRPAGRDAIDEQWKPEPGEIQFFLNDVEDGVWVSRRDERVTRPVGQLTTRSPAGTPIVIPEIQLLCKAKHHKERDEHDFCRALGALSPLQQAWLRGALEIVHPNDPWLDSL